MEGLVLQNVTSGYDHQVVFKNLNLEVKPKTTLVLMGVSGTGKTTLLKTILGILKPLQGSIYLAGRNISNLPIEERNIGYVPQNYGLFPHLDVAANISFGLQVRHVPPDEQKKIIEQMIHLIELKGYEHKKITELSGGQQQRVALGRALAVKPDLFLLDEPLSNIDQATKFDVASDMKKLFDSLNIPIILVTHQYEDAQFFGANVAIMVEGIIVQIGSYEELVAHPKNPFVKKLLVPFAQF